MHSQRFLLASGTPILQLSWRALRRELQRLATAAAEAATAQFAPLARGPVVGMSKRSAPPLCARTTHLANKI